MTSVRCALQEGFVAITAPGMTAVVEVADRHVDALTNAASEGLVPFLDLLCSRGLLVMPSFGIVTTDGDGVRAVLRGTVTLVRSDGSVLSAGAREPWSDVDVADAGDEVVLTAPEPEPVVARGWRRPARLRGSAPVVDAVPSPEPAVVLEPEPTPGPEVVEESEPAVVLDAEPEPDVVPAPEAEPERAPEPESEVVPQPQPTPDADVVHELGPEPEPEPDLVPVPVPAPLHSDLTLPPPQDAPGASPADRVPPSAPQERSIIDSVPWRRAGGGGAAPFSPPGPASRPVTRAYDAPPPPPVPDVAALAVDAQPDPEHDRGALPEHTAAPEPEPEDVVPPAPPASDEAPPADVTTSRDALPRNDEDLDRPVVLAVLCPAGHHSPPHAGRCRTCQREIPPQQPTPIPRPQLGVLRISSGGSVPLDRGVLLGRAPRVNDELPANQRPHLIRLGGDRDISRNHAEVVLEGWHVLVRDLGSTNGTTIALPGEEPVRLRPTEDQGIEPGTVITLADEVSLTYEVEG